MYRCKTIFVLILVSCTYLFASESAKQNPVTGSCFKKIGNIGMQLEITKKTEPDGSAKFQLNFNNTDIKNPQKKEVKQVFDDFNCEGMTTEADKNRIAYLCNGLSQNNVPTIIRLDQKSDGNFIIEFQSKNSVDTDFNKVDSGAKIQDHFNCNLDELNIKVKSRKNIGEQTKSSDSISENTSIPQVENSANPLSELTIDEQIDYVNKLIKIHGSDYRVNTTDSTQEIEVDPTISKTIKNQNEHRTDKQKNGDNLPPEPEQDENLEDSDLTPNDTTVTSSQKVQIESNQRRKSGYREFFVSKKDGQLYPDIDSKITDSSQNQ